MTTKSDTLRVTHFECDETSAHISNLERQLAETRRLLAEASKDAERYRWLRDTKAYVAVDRHHLQLPKNQRTGWTIRLVSGNDESMDAAIDAAIKEQP